MQQIGEFKEKYPLTYKKEGLSGPFVMDEIYRQTKGDAIIVTEVGQHQMWAAQYYKFSNPRTLLTSGGLGTMGYGLGAAIGAQVANPEKQVINIAGDGCFRMNMNASHSSPSAASTLSRLSSTIRYLVWYISGRAYFMRNVIPTRS